ncbi:alpha/beta hydrolase family protein [Chitinophaga sp. LS1]|uniref:alpha/beta hydrolase n=1 Tax=Chitinophaga sp. LS1 TaxID=3051176 RepID=UPI002AAC0D94|nr:alpha/beta hydrolase family protein [Chitinophaga sp. LS1]WPV67926.1 alpha/beta hydrolase family protein [Chitinophaga sp. LS1]
MKRKFFYCLLLSFAVVGLSHAQTFVLVHGAWHGGWCWKEVAKELQAQGAEVYTPTLSGLGEHQNVLDTNINLETHIQDIVNFINMQDLHDVILVGHSYAGAVIAGVADRIPARLKKLIFLDAMLIENGKSALTSQPANLSDNVRAATASSQGLSVPVWSPEVFGVTDPAQIKWVSDRLTPQPFRSFDQTLSLKHVYGNHLPLTYIACIKPQMAQLKVFGDKTKSSKDWSYYELPTGHDAMITMPKELTALLYKISQVQ